MPRDERRTSGRPTRRREPVIRAAEVTMDAAARDVAPDRYGGPLRRRDDPGVGLRTPPRSDDGYAGARPASDHRSEESLREEIFEQLIHHPDVHPADIDVQVEGGEVTLQGTVEDRNMRWLVEDLVESVSGVSLVHNRLRVAPR
jgi:hypothetical protein